MAITDELLGKGGFGEVYLADYNGHNAAAKVVSHFRPIVLNICSTDAASRAWSEEDQPPPICRTFFYFFLLFRCRPLSLYFSRRLTTQVQHITHGLGRLGENDVLNGPKSDQPDALREKSQRKAYCASWTPWFASGILTPSTGRSPHCRTA